MYFYFGKFVSKIRAFGNNTCFGQQLYSVSGGGGLTPSSPATPLCPAVQLTSHLLKAFYQKQLYNLKEGFVFLGELQHLIRTILHLKNAIFGKLICINSWLSRVNTLTEQYKQRAEASGTGAGAIAGAGEQEPAFRR